MAPSAPRPKPRHNPTQPDLNRYPPRPPAGPPEVVSPAWIVKALASAILAAVTLAYLSVCLLVHLGASRYLLHPSARVDTLPASPFQAVRFDAGDDGHPRLTGWWIPAAAPATAAPTVLYLHDGSGSLSTSVAKLNLIHQANLDIFAIDYRGFGRSEPPFPNQRRMLEDASAALAYLIDIRHLASERILPYGEGLGGVLAASLAQTHPRLRAVVIDNPDPDAFARATEAKSRLLPMRLLVPDRFDIAQPLSASRLPKLLLADGPSGWEAERLHANQRLFDHVPDPKVTVTFGRPFAEDQYLAALRRFVDQYLPR